jgi:hypothetical protein
MVPVSSRHSVGHTKIPFCLQSCVKPLTYAISVSTLGTDYVHKFVGKEPSGLRYNKLSLNEEGEHLQGSGSYLPSEPRASPPPLCLSLCSHPGRNWTQPRLASEWEQCRVGFLGD